MTVECAGWKNTSCDDGPGIRSVLFFQGCSMHCPGCQNAQTHKQGAGTVFTVDEIITYIDKHCHNKKITISGGEPLEQMESLYSIIDILNKKKYNICIYTGWSFDQVPAYIKENTDYIKCGGFDLAKKDSSLMYVGSYNQKMYHNLRNGKFDCIPLMNREAV